MTRHLRTTGSAASTLKHRLPGDGAWDVDAFIVPLDRIDGHLHSLRRSEASAVRAIIRRARLRFALLLGATDPTTAGQANRKLDALGHVRRRWFEERRPPGEDVWERLVSVAMGHEMRRWGIGIPAKHAFFGQEDFFLTERTLPPSLSGTATPPTDADIRHYWRFNHGTIYESTLLAHLRRPEGRSTEPVSAREEAEANLATASVLWLLKRVCWPISSDNEYRAKLADLETLLFGAGDDLGSSCLAMVDAALEFDLDELAAQKGDTSAADARVQAGA